MFIVCSGRVAVLLGKDGHEVATIEQGDYFGEMSLLTGEPRTATVVARGDVRVMEVSVDSFRQLAASDPASMERVAAVVARRRAELDAARSSVAAADAVETPTTLLARMRRFLRFA
jgi:CRP-like cAMP-binding protein